MNKRKAVAAAQPGAGDLVLPGPDGGNPLGFLAALGTLRVATLVWSDRAVRMGWTEHGTGWRPLLAIDPPVTPADLLAGLERFCRWGPEVATSENDAGDPQEVPPEEAFPYLAFDRNTTKIEPDRFRDRALEAGRTATPEDRAAADFLAAIGCEACVEDGYVLDTAFRTMSGAGHQHFLGTMLDLASEVREEHLRSALLEPWRYKDPLKSLSMRWDPNDLKQHALQWQNPSTDPSRAKRGSVLGANRLAVEALPLFPSVPVGRVIGRPGLRTTGFSARRRDPYWTWPIWTEPTTLEVCGSLVAHPALQELTEAGEPTDGGYRRLPPRELLRQMGVAEVFRSRRITVDYYRNLTPARAV